MIERLDYYQLEHFCPFDAGTELQLRELQERFPDMRIRSYSILREPSHLIAHSYFLINDAIRLMGPLFSLEVLMRFHTAGLLSATRISYSAPPRRTVPLSVKMYDAAAVDFCACCRPAGTVPQEQIDWKSQWISGAKRTAVEGNGMVGYREGHPVCAVEWIHAACVSSPLHDPTRKTAFVVCWYPGEGQVDYRPSLVPHLEQALRAEGYQAVAMIVGEVAVYPNGPLAMFRELGFRTLRPLGRMYFTTGTWDDLYLLRKELQ